MDLRVNKDADSIKIPTGFIPLYTDLERLFKDVLDKNYSKEDYVKQFSVRIPENLAKIERMKNIFTTRVLDTPEIVFKVLNEQQKRLISAKNQFGDYISPDSF
jgi:phosphoenolpyruvate carboxykinase (GTP)